MIDLTEEQTRRYFQLRYAIREANEWLEDAIHSDPFWEVGRQRGEKMVADAEAALVAEFPLPVDEYPYWSGQDGTE